MPVPRRRRPVAAWTPVDVRARRDASTIGAIARARACAPRSRARRHRRRAVPRQPLDVHARPLRRPRGPRLARRRRAARSATDVGAPRRRRSPPGMAPAARARLGASACSSGRTPRPSSSPPAGLDALAARRLGGALQLGAHRRAPDRAASRGGRGPTAATPACTRRTSTTPATRSAPSTSPATCRSSSGPTARASAASSARRSWRPPSAGSSASCAPATRCGSCRGRAGRREPADASGRAGSAGPPTPIEPRGPAGVERAPRRPRRGPATRVLAPRRRPPTTTRPASPTAAPATASCSSSTAPMTLDLELRLRVHALDRWVGDATSAPALVDATAGRPLAARPGRRRPADRSSARSARCAPREDELADVVDASRSRRGSCTCRCRGTTPRPARPSSATCTACAPTRRGARGTSSSSAASTASTPSTTCTASCSTPRYLVLGLGDVYLGAPVATPLDPRHRLVTTKYNPARTWTPENAVGIGGAYLCIYGMEGPGGYQFVGRTVQVWNRDRRGPALRPSRGCCAPSTRFGFTPSARPNSSSSARRSARGELAIQCESTMFRLSEQRSFLREHADEIVAFKSRQQAAFDEERCAWAAAGEVA